MALDDQRADILKFCPRTKALLAVVCRRNREPKNGHGVNGVSESSVEILGHSVGDITYRHYARRAPLAFEAILTVPQPAASSALLEGSDGECPCCLRRFADAA